MQTKMLSKNDKSCIAIKNGKVYVISTEFKDFSPRAITIINGFQIELGRSIEDFQDALCDEEVRIPIIINCVLNAGINSQYAIMRMKTGNVPDKSIALVLCKNRIITSVSFNRDLITDREYRKYNQLSALHQLSIPYDFSQGGFYNRTHQVTETLKAVITSNIGVVNVNEDENKMIVGVPMGMEKTVSYFRFIRSKNRAKFELMSISLEK
jgi:hypothetical protein